MLLPVIKKIVSILVLCQPFVLKGMGSEKFFEMMKANLEPLDNPELIKNLKTSILGSELAEAAKNGDQNKVKKLCELGENPNRNYINGMPLHLAARYGHEGAVRSLLEHNADPNLPNSFGYRPLESALHGRNGNVVRLLLDKGGANPNYNSYKEKSLLLNYIENPGNDIEMIWLLQEFGAQLYVKDHNYYQLCSEKFSKQEDKETVLFNLLSQAHEIKHGLEEKNKKLKQRLNELEASK